MGGYLGAVIGFSILGMEQRRRRTEYTIDHQHCLSCGRCFYSCPQERLRLKLLKQKAGHIEN